MIRRLLLVPVAGSIATTALAAPAGAATSCAYDPVLHTVQIQMTAHRDSARVEVLPGGTIEIAGAGGPAVCAGGDPTTTTTESIHVVDTSDDPATAAPGDGDTTVTLVRPQELSPGVTIENGDPAFSEIEVTLSLGSGLHDRLALIGSAGADVWRLGNGGFNANAGVPDPAHDPDVTWAPVDELQILAGDGDDAVTLHGAADVGAPFSQATAVELRGGAGDDALSGGDTPTGDLLDGGPGDDILWGFSGDDRIYPDGDAGDLGADTVVGGPGVDTVDYGAANGPVAVDLAIAGAQDTGQGLDTLAGLEVVRGSAHDDVLRGGAGGELLAGRDGDDLLVGRGGSDVLDGGPGIDTASYEDAPGGVTVDLGTGAASGADGTDTVVTENVIGSPFADLLAGDGADNRITGLGGVDVVGGRGGADVLDVRDGGADSVDCGAGADQVIADEAGVDTIAADCETVARPAAGGSGGGGGSGGSGGLGGGGGGGMGGIGDPAAPGAPDGGGSRPAQSASSATVAAGGSALGLSVRVRRVVRTRAIVLRVACRTSACRVRATAAGARRAEAVRLAPARARTVTVRLGARARARLTRALADGRRPRLAVRVSAVGATGARATRRVAVRFRG